MQIYLPKEYLRKAVSDGSYIKYPFLSPKGRDYLLISKINEDYAKGAVELLAKSAACKVSDISGEHMKYRIKDRWFSIANMHVAQKLFLIAYMATELKKEVTLRYGFNQMKPKTLRNFITAFKDSDYVNLICEHDLIGQIKPLLTDNKLLAVIVQPDNEEVFIRMSVGDAFQEVSETKYVDNIHDYDVFKMLPFSAERFNAVKNALWAEKVYSHDNIICIQNPINEPSYELRQLFELCCRESSALLLNEPDVFLDVQETKLFYNFLERVRVTFNAIYLSEYR